jgi:hypothetical protein
LVLKVQIEGGVLGHAEDRAEEKHKQDWKRYRPKQGGFASVPRSKSAI